MNRYQRIVLLVAAGLPAIIALTVVLLVERSNAKRAAEIDARTEETLRNVTDLRRNPRP